MTDQPSAAPEQPAPPADADASEQATPLHGVGPFTTREFILLVISALVLLLSFFSIYDRGYAPIWMASLDWVLAVGLPVAAGVLLLVRRVASGSLTRVGSLSIDQFASVAFSVSVVTWLSTIGYGIDSMAGGAPFSITAAAWLQLLLTLAGVFFTVVAPFVAPFKDDFAGRPESPARPAARAPRPVAARPRPQPASWQQDAPANGAWAQPQPYGQQPYGEPPQYGQPYGHAPYGQQPAYGQAPHRAPYGQQPYGAPAYPAPYGQQPYPAPAPYGQSPAAYGQQYPLAPEGAPAGHGPAETGPTAAYAAEEDVATSVVPVQHAPSDDAVEPTAQAQPGEAADDTTRENNVVGAPADGASAAEQSAAPAAQAFWALAPDERDVVDAYGTPLFRIGPTAWALVIEDRGDVYVVRHDDGRIGYLHDTSGITRG